MTHDLMTLTKLKDDCIVIGVAIGLGLATGLGLGIGLGVGLAVGLGSGLGLGLVLRLGVGVIGSRVMSHVIATPCLRYFTAWCTYSHIVPGAAFYAVVCPSAVVISNYTDN